MWTVEFEYERSTKNTHRFQEVTEDAPKIGTLYVKKYALEGTPAFLRVTVEQIVKLSE